LALSFAKLEAAGNCYLAVDGRSVERDWSALARAMGREHFGVGSDGLVIALDSRLAALRMRVFNSDGSEAEMSGNGIRLLAKFALDRGMAAAGAEGLLIETRAGLRRVWPEFEDARMVRGRVSMGTPRLLERDLPLALGARTLLVTTLSLGNPHAVALLDEPVADFPLALVGPRVVDHVRFPERTNFEVANVVGPGRLEARIFERGEGETLSSGTGSTACAVAARAAGRTGDSVLVDLRGGTLRVEWPGEGEAWLEGPTREVFTGVWPD
jgi:diaminopimelate epimerase